MNEAALQKVLDSMTALRSDIKADLKKEIGEVKDMINARIDKVEEKIIEAENTNKLLKLQIERQNKKIQKLERDAIKNNLVIYGLEETERTREDLEESIVSLFTRKLNTPTTKEDIQLARRIGKTSDKARPILVSTLNQKKRDQIFKNKKLLRGSSIYINEELPQDIMETRRKLIPELRRLREEGKEAYLKYDKIITPETGIAKQHRNKETAPIAEPNPLPTPTKKTGTKPKYVQMKLQTPNMQLRSHANPQDKTLQLENNTTSTL